MEINDSIKELLNSKVHEDQRIALEILKNTDIPASKLCNVYFIVLKDYFTNYWEIWLNVEKTKIKWKET